MLLRWKEVNGIFQKYLRSFKRSVTLTDQEMIHVFNMGIGMVLFVSKSDVKTVLSDLEKAKEPSTIIGEVIKGDRIVHIV